MQFFCEYRLSEKQPKILIVSAFSAKFTEIPLTSLILKVTIFSVVYCALNGFLLKETLWRSVRRNETGNKPVNVY
jgi:hypothetical protein